MVICVEGQDCTGKSSMVERLKEAFNLVPKRKDKFSVHHFDKPIGETNEEKYAYQMGQFSLMFDMILSSESYHNWIFDRSHIGEMVYGPMWRNKFPEYLNKMEKDFIEKYQDIAVVIYLKCDTKVIQKRFESRPNEKCPTIEEIENDNNLFKDALSKTNFDVIEVDTTNINVTQVCNEVCNRLHHYILEKTEENK